MFVGSHTWVKRAEMAMSSTCERCACCWVSQGPRLGQPRLCALVTVRAAVRLAAGREGEETQEAGSKDTGSTRQRMQALPIRTPKSDSRQLISKAESDPAGEIPSGQTAVGCLFAAKENTEHGQREGRMQTRRCENQEPALCRPPACLLTPVLPSRYPGTRVLSLSLSLSLSFSPSLLLSFGSLQALKLWRAADIWRPCIVAHRRRPYRSSRKSRPPRPPAPWPSSRPRSRPCPFCPRLSSSPWCATAAIESACVAALSLLM